MPAIQSSIKTQNLAELTALSGNLYKSIVIISKRARHIAVSQKEELNSKLAEFASTVDNLEEIFENKEQIEISRFYERLPKPAIIAMQEFLNNNLAHRMPDETYQEESMNENYAEG